METIWIIIILALLVVALIGTFVPVLPSITIAWSGMLILYLVADNAVSNELMLWITVVAVLVKVLDIVLPLWGVKIFGGTKKGVNGATVGLIIASVLAFTPLVVIFPPVLAMIVFPIIGAFVGELIAEDGDMNKAIGGAAGSILGFFLTIGLKFAMVIWYACITVEYIVDLLSQ